MLGILSAIAGPLISRIFDTVDEVVEDKDKAIAIKAQIKKQVNTMEMKEFEGATKIVLAEAQGKSWMQRSWRPILMLSIIAIIVNNYIIYPYMLSFLPGTVPMLELPGGLWALLTVGVGGYVGGRSVEKVMDKVAFNRVAKSVTSDFVK